MGPGVVPQLCNFKYLQCQTTLTATMGAKGILLQCKTETGTRAACPLCANNRHFAIHSITSSARAAIPAALAGRDRLDWETPQASAALSDVAGGDLVFVGGEGCQDFALLALRDLEEV